MANGSGLTIMGQAYESPEREMSEQPATPSRTPEIGSPGSAPSLTQAAAAPESAPESPLWAGRTHWSHYIGSVLLGILFAVLIGYFCYHFLSGSAAWKTGSLLILVCALVVSGRVLWNILSSRYRITTQRLFIERGILSQTIDQTELVRVDDVRVRRGLIDRMLGLGTIEVISTDATDQAVMMEGVRNPQAVAEHIRERMRLLRKKSVFVENL
jgi:membrane protein YdbS with pleckstrin-like domain